MDEGKRIGKRKGNEREKYFKKLKVTGYIARRKPFHLTLEGKRGEGSNTININAIVFYEISYPTLFI